MAKIDSHRDLLVWQKAMELVVQAYQLSPIPCLSGKRRNHRAAG